MKSYVMVVDDFYKDPDAVRRKGLSLPFTEPEGFVGWRTRAYQPKRIRELIEEKFRLRITYWEEDLSAIESCNGVFFSSYSAGSHAETVGVHFDWPITWVMFLIYLTPDAPFDAGTSIWQHRATGLTTRPTRKDAERLGTTVEKLLALLSRDRHTRSRWREIDRIGNRYNRAVMFPGGLLHSATRHFGSNPQNGRIYQSFHFPVKLKK